MYCKPPLRKPPLRIALLVAAVTLMATGCRSQNQNVLGKWKEMGGTEVLEFFDDNRVAINDKGASTVGSWTLLNDGRVKIEAGALGFTSVVTGEVAGETLVLRMGEKQSRYERFKPPAERLIGSFAGPTLTCTFAKRGEFTSSSREGKFSGSYEFLEPGNPFGQRGAEIVAYIPGVDFPACHPVSSETARIWPSRPGACSMFMRLARGDALEFLDLTPDNSGKEEREFHVGERLVRGDAKHP
jgi:hypothetical protein